MAEQLPTAQLNLKLDSLYESSGVAVAADGSIFIADTRNATIRRIAGSSASDAGVIRSVAGKWAPAQNVQLAEPMAIALDRAGNLYIADHAANAVIELRAATAAAVGRLEVIAHVPQPAEHRRDGGWRPDFRCGSGSGKCVCDRRADARDFAASRRESNQRKPGQRGVYRRFRVARERMLQRECGRRRMDPKAFAPRAWPLTAAAIFLLRTRRPNESFAWTRSPGKSPRLPLRSRRREKLCLTRTEIFSSRSRAAIASLKFEASASRCRM